MVHGSLRWAKLYPLAQVAVSVTSRGHQKGSELFTCKVGQSI